jgi:hypothetical protein
LNRTSKIGVKSNLKKLFYDLHRNGIWYFIIIAQGAGINAVMQPTGLDLGYNWYLNYAIRHKFFGSGDFFGPYGPLGFLEIAFPDWRIGFVSMVLFRIVIAIQLFRKIRHRFDGIVPSGNAVSLLSLLFTTFIMQTQFASTAIFIIYLIEFIKPRNTHREIPPFENYIDGVILGVLFFIKPLQFLLILILLTSKYINKPSQSFTAIYRLILGSFSISLIVFLVSEFTFKNFVIWLRGYFEISTGYSSMSTEEVGRLIEYPIFAILVIFIMYQCKKFLDFPDLLILFCAIFIIFRYGFNRHDGHSIFSFVLLCTIILLLPVSKWAIHWSVASILIVFAVSSYNPNFLLDPGSRIQATYTSVKLLVDPIFRESQHSSANLGIQSHFNLPAEISSKIASKSVALLPWPGPIDRFAAVPQEPPVSSLFSAYTPWLDNENAKWVSSKMAPDYMLLAPPITIDGRYSWWDSPRFWVEVLCNYETDSVSDNWLLLRKRILHVCDGSITRTVQVIEGTSKFQSNSVEQFSIGIIDIKTEKSFVSKVTSILFKPRNPNFIKLNGQEYRTVDTNQTGLIFSIPDVINFPGIWKIPSLQKLETAKVSEFTVKQVYLNK